MHACPPHPSLPGSSYRINTYMYFNAREKFMYFCRLVTCNLYTQILLMRCMHRYTSGYPGQDESCLLQESRWNILEGYALKDTPSTSRVP